MALMAWYPFHKDTNDWSGFGNHVKSGELTPETGVIGGNVLVSDSYIEKNEQLDRVLSGTEATLCFWVKVEDGGENWADIISYSPSSGANTVRYERGSVNVNVNKYDYWCNFFNGSVSGGGSYVTNYEVGPIDDWYHICIRRSGDLVEIFVNASVDRSYTATGPISSPSGIVRLNVNLLAKSRLQDLRFYDNAISNRQIYDISRGKMVHYGFNSDFEFLPNNRTNNPDFIPGTPYSNNVWDNTLNGDAIKCSGWSTGYNSGVASPEKGYHARWVNVAGKAVMLMNNSNAEFGVAKRWLGIYSAYPNVESLGLTNGDVVTVSWSQRSNVAGDSFAVGFYTRKADNTAKWEAGKITHRHNVADEWERKSYTTVIGDDTDISRSLQLYFYGHYSKDGTILECKDIQLEPLRDVANPYRKFSNDDVQISDSSGFNRNGVIEVDYAPSFVKGGDSCSGTNYFHFPSKDRTTWDDIRRQIRTSHNHMSTQISISIWARTSLKSTGRNPLMKYDDGVYTHGIFQTEGGILICIENGKFRMHGWGSGDPKGTTDVSDGKWHHLVWTYDYKSRLSNMYVDGVREVNDYVDSENRIQPMSNFVWTVGANLTPYADITNTTFNGDIADVEMYGRILSEDDVKLLYSTRASVDNQHVAHAQEFNEGWDSSGNLDIEVRSTSSTVDSGIYIDSVKMGVQRAARGINFCIFDQSMKLRGYGNLDTYAGTVSEQYYEFDGVVYVKDGNDINDSAQEASDWIVHAIDKMEDGWLMTAARNDASSPQDGSLTAAFRDNFGVSEPHDVENRGTWGFMGIKHGELIFEFSEGKRYDPATNERRNYTKSGRAIGDFHKPSVTSDGVMHAGELIESYYRPSLLDYSTWENGSVGTSQPGFTNYGRSFDISVAKNPWGEDDVMWRAYSDSDTQQSGGFYTPLVDIDPTKHHRFTIWLRRSVSGNGNWYVGCARDNLTASTDGVINENPYFDYGTNYFDNEWVILVGYLYANGTTDTDTFTDHGIYDVNGKRLSDIDRNFTMADGATKNYMRAFLYRSTAVDTEQFFYRPRIDVMDGSQPTLQELLSGSESMSLLPRYGQNNLYDKRGSSFTNDDALFDEFSEI